jgi:hypothetical protein
MLATEPGDLLEGYDVMFRGGANTFTFSRTQIVYPHSDFHLISSQSLCLPSIPLEMFP